MRGSGILLPVSSLNNPYGIGALGKEAYAFIDFLAAAGQRFWQVLPLGPTSYGDSPYQTFSAFAGNPYFIDFDLLRADGLLEPDDYQWMASGDGDIDYAFQYRFRYQVLRKAYRRFRPDEEYRRFLRENERWLDDYAVFMAIKSVKPEGAWDRWDEALKFRRGTAFTEFFASNREETGFWTFLQYCFYRQWERLKAYANAKGIIIIGDLPYYVAYDSSDVWANPHAWQLDGDLAPLAVAGCPPDAFSIDGQLWGNPLYDYAKMAAEGYSWWIARFRHAFKIYDWVRIDHFRGFEAYYAIPYPAKTARSGAWIKGPGSALFKRIKEELGSLPIIAEDLGYLTEDVHRLLEETGFMGMKVLQFAFDHRDDSVYLPHHHVKNAVCYPGTHDNPPVKAWFTALAPEDRKFVSDYLGIRGPEEAVERLVKAALASVCAIAIIPMQDYLELGATARLNTPATLGGNWRWRLREGDLDPALAKKISAWTKIYRR
ncbi:MAG TPA: 4-alpha-glucanotransferase [Acholeplasmataceae bacterium]|jgi:4-alpha-glucanotransferase|nr:4-alpha-glucanotransferase [Acholeplasmataceae bacterium]